LPKSRKKKNKPTSPPQAGRGDGFSPLLPNGLARPGLFLSG